MDDKNEILNQLLAKLEELTQQQNKMTKEMDHLRNQLFHLKYSKDATPEKKKEDIPEKSKQDIPKDKPIPIEENKQDKAPLKPVQQPIAATKVPTKKHQPAQRDSSALERFIGENLINKIGIIITVIGVAIGAKYSIDNNLISPTTRILIGYIIGFGLVGVGIRLRKKYPNYSAVLVSGSMAIMYFITYAAYQFYELIPQGLTFGLMVLFTVFTVVAALSYKNQIIALIGLVGAYTIPFLIGDDNGSATTLFSYMAIINLGILIISFLKKWRIVELASFVMTWFIYFFWFGESYDDDEHFNTAMVFSCIFFILYYLLILGYKLIHKEVFHLGDIILILINSFIFYAVGYYLLYDYSYYEGSSMTYPYMQYLGIFTILNALIHFSVSAVIYTQKLGDRNLFYFITGLVLVFVTIAIPVELDGHWVTLLWAALSGLTFWIGRKWKVGFYEGLSYGLLFITGISWLLDYGYYMGDYFYDGESDQFRPLFNINFLASMLIAAMLGFVSYVDGKHVSNLFGETMLSKLMTYLINAAFIGTLFIAGCIEINLYYDQIYYATRKDIYDAEYDYNFWKHDSDLELFKSIWLLNFTMIFAAVMTLLNQYVIKNKALSYVNNFINTITTFLFLLIGLYLCSLLRDSYMEQTDAEYFDRGTGHIIIRYISIAIMGLMTWANWRIIKSEYLGGFWKSFFEVILALTLLWLISSEIIYHMTLADYGDSYKLGLSIFWGIFSLITIGIGIWKKKKHLRMAAIALFAVTLIKLFFYDIAHLNTISKTIIFISLGILLLIISFLYNKYTQVIFDEADHS